MGWDGVGKECKTEEPRVIFLGISLRLHTSTC